MSAPPPMEPPGFPIPAEDWTSAMEEGIDLAIDSGGDAFDYAMAVLTIRLVAEIEEAS